MVYDVICQDEEDERDVQIDFDLVRCPPSPVAKDALYMFGTGLCMLWTYEGKGPGTEYAVPACCVYLLHLSSSISPNPPFLCTE